MSHHLTTTTTHKSLRTTATGTPMTEIPTTFTFRKTRIAQHLDSMNEVELRSAASRALHALAYQNADVDGNPEHEAFAYDHLHQATTFDMDQERKSFAEEQMEAGIPDDAANANWYRRLLNLEPLDANGDAVAPEDVKAARP